MAELNFNKQKDISMLIPGGEEPIVIPVNKAYSWGKIIATQLFLDKICDTVRKWYWSRKNLEGVIDGYPALWKHLIDTISEGFLLDYINQGVFGLNKEDMGPYHNPDYGVMFERSFDNIKDVWGGLSIEQLENQAYRALRKEARGRVRGIGFGLQGGIKAAIGAELGNAATGLAHGVFNAIGNSIDNAKISSRMNDFYNQESTLDDIIEILSVIFWRMYDEQIEFLNNNICVVEADSPKIYNYSEMMGFKDAAEIIIQNMQKAVNLSGMDAFGAVCDCIENFPFETEYWKAFLLIMIPIQDGSREIVSAFSDFAKEMDEYVPSFSGEFDMFLLESILNVYFAKKEENSDYSGNEIIEQLIDKKDDEYFENNLLMILIGMIENSEIDFQGIFTIRELIKNIGMEISHFFENSKFKSAYEKRINTLTFSHIQEYFETIYKPAILNGNIEIAVKVIKEKFLIELEKFLFLIIEKIHDIVSEEKLYIGHEIIDNLEKLKNALNVEKDLNVFEKYRLLRLMLLTVEQKTDLFYKFVQSIINANGEKSLGTRVYWGTIPPDIIQKLFKGLERDPLEEDKPLMVIDNTLLHSWKDGYFITTKGIWRNSWGISWENLAAKGRLEINVTDNINIDHNGKGENTIRSEQMIFLEINVSVLANIIYGACLIFSGRKCETLRFTSVDGAEFDISKLEEGEPVLLTKLVKSEGRFNYLREDDRIYTARKFKERKGFFRHILPASWILTIGFYGLVALIIMMAAYIAIPQNSETIRLIIALLTVLVIPIALWVFGIKKRVKYIKEKKKWKECTDSGKRDIKEVYKEFQEMENEYIGL